MTLFPGKLRAIILALDAAHEWNVSDLLPTSRCLNGTGSRCSTASDDSNGSDPSGSRAQVNCDSNWDGSQKWCWAELDQPKKGGGRDNHFVEGDHFGRVVKDLKAALGRRSCCVDNSYGLVSAEIEVVDDLVDDEIEVVDGVSGSLYISSCSSIVGVILCICVISLLVHPQIEICP